MPAAEESFPNGKLHIFIITAIFIHQVMYLDFSLQFHFKFRKHCRISLYHFLISWMHFAVLQEHSNPEPADTYHRTGHCFFFSQKENKFCKTGPCRNSQWKLPLPSMRTVQCCRLDVLMANFEPVGKQWDVKFLSQFVLWGL